MSDIKWPMAVGNAQYEEVLNCPRCGCNNIHLNGVSDDVLRKQDETIRLSFWCEGCAGEKTPDLCLRTHKGCTYVYWDGEQEQENIETIKQVWGRFL